MPPKSELWNKEFKEISPLKKKVYTASAAAAELQSLLDWAKEQPYRKFVCCQSRWWFVVIFYTNNASADSRSGSYGPPARWGLWCKDTHPETPNNKTFAPFSKPAEGLEYARTECLDRRAAPTMVAQPQPSELTRTERLEKRSGEPVELAEESPMKKAKQKEEPRRETLPDVAAIVLNTDGAGGTHDFGAAFPDVRVLVGISPISSDGWRVLATALWAAKQWDAVALGGVLRLLTPPKSGTAEKPGYYKTNMGLTAKGNNAAMKRQRKLHVYLATEFGARMVVTIDILTIVTVFMTYIKLARAAGINKESRPLIAGAAGRMQGNKFIRHAIGQPMRSHVRAFLVTTGDEYERVAPAKYAEEMRLLKPACYYIDVSSQVTIDPRAGLDGLADGLPFASLSINMQTMPTGKRAESGCAPLAYMEHMELPDYYMKPEAVPWKQLYGTGLNPSPHFQNTRGEHDDPDHRHGLASISSFTVTTAGKPVLQGGTYIAPLGVGKLDGRGSYLQLPSNVSGLVPFHAHQHFGAGIAPHPGVDYPAIAGFAGVGAIDLSIVAQVGAGLADSQDALHFAGGRAFGFTNAQSRYLVELGLLVANAGERKDDPSLKKLPVNKEALPSMWTEPELAEVMGAFDKLHANWAYFMSLVDDE